MSQETPKETSEAPAPTIPVSEQSPSSTNKKPKRSLGKIIALVVGAFILALIAIFVIIFFLTRGAAEAADEIIANLQSGNCTTIYSEQAAPAFQALGTQEQWDTECERVGGVLTGEPDQTGVSIEGSTGEASTSLVTYEILGTDGITYTVNVSMVKVDGEWKMSAFNSDGQVD